MALYTLSVTAGTLYRPLNAFLILNLEHQYGTAERGISAILRIPLASH
jgi:hypothetical protein